MDTTSFKFFPPEAAHHAFAVDGLALFITAVSIFFSVLVAAMVVYLAVRYRRRPNEKFVPKPDPSHTHLGFMLELTWTIVPIGIVAVMFLAGAKVFVRSQHPPRDAKEYYVEGKRWMWKTQDVATGAREIDSLHLPAGVPVRLIMISDDVIHDFGVPAFRMKMDVVPGRYTSEWFLPERPGEYHLFCDQYCGTNHSKMIGTITVMEPAKYRQWLDGHIADDAPRVAGEKLFGQYGCVTCHATRAPTMAGLYGRPVPLEGGSTIIADDNYLRESIFYPSAKIVKGFPPLMPSFRGQLTEEQVMDLVEYIKSLAGATTETYQLPPMGPTTQPNRAVPGPGPFVPVQAPQGIH
jgi:cytochrome c oxidase subunit 2